MFDLTRLLYTSTETEKNKNNKIKKQLNKKK